ncbi:MAG: hypothetical protein ACFFG0_21010 [Candidatus Thorarchaeota archaeon]
MSDVINIIKERNVKWGILISALVTTTFYVIISIISIIVGFIIYTGFTLFADLEFLLGSIIGVLYFFKNREAHQELLKYGVIVGIFGGLLACIFISIYQTPLAMIFSGAPLTVFFLYVGFTFLSGAVIGLLTGAFIAVYYVYKETRGEKVGKEHFDDDFFEDLIDK